MYVICEEKFSASASPQMWIFVRARTSRYI